jgi:hypothetical protein
MLSWFKRKALAATEYAEDVEAEIDASTARSWGWLKILLIALVIFIPCWYLIGGLVYQRINDDVDFRQDAALADPGQSRAVATAAALIKRETKRWSPNEQFWSPAITLDNMPNYQLGIVEAVSRFAIEMVDQLGRQRGSSASDKDLEAAAGYLRYDGTIWIMQDWKPTASAEAQYTRAVEAFEKYNNRLAAGDAIYDKRADNLIALLSRIAADMGSASAALDQRTLESNAGYFDFGADEILYNVKGKLYAYYLILRDVGVDYSDVIAGKQLKPIWERMLSNFRRAAGMNPLIVSNGAQDGAIMPSHLSALGFYLLRARVQLREVTDTLAK